MQLEPIMKTLRFYCISKQQSIREDSLPFSVKVSDRISRVRLKSSAFQSQATSNIQASYDGVWLRDTFVHKFLLPELYKHTSNPWQSKTRESLEEACRTKKSFCTPGDDFFPYIVWQILSNKKIVHVISNKAELIPQTDALPDQHKTTLDCPYKIIADLEKLTFRTLNMQLTTSYAVNGVTEFGTKPGSQLAVFDFGMLEASIKWFKMPNAFLGTLATSFFHKLDVNGKGAATRSDRSAEWQISGDLGSGLYRFVNMFAMKKLFSTLFPPLKTPKTLKKKKKDTYIFYTLLIIEKYCTASTIYRRHHFICQATFYTHTFKLSVFKIPIKPTETSQQKYRLVRFFVQFRTPVPATSQSTVNARTSVISTAIKTMAKEVAQDRFLEGMNIAKCVFNVRFNAVVTD